MILKTNPAHRSGRAGALIALGFALCLPFGMARSDEPQDNPPPPPPPPPERRGDDPPPPARGERPREERRTRNADDQAPTRSASNRNAGNPEELQRLREEMRKAEEQMVQAQQRIERLRNRLEELGEKMPRPNAIATTQPRPAAGGFGGGGGLGASAGGGMRGHDADTEKKILQLRLEELTLRETYGDEHPAVKQVRRKLDEIMHATAPRPAGSGAPGREGARGGPVGPIPSTPATPSPTVSVPRDPSSDRRPGFSPFQGNAGGSDQRIDELTKAVAELKRAVDEMRRDRERDRRPPQPQP